MLLKNNTTIIRVLKTQDGRSLIIDCIKRTMPKWVDSTSLSAYTECSEADLYIQMGMIQDRELTPDEQRIAQERYTMIAPILPFIGNDQKRSQMIDLLSQGIANRRSVGVRTISDIPALSCIGLESHSVLQIGRNHG